MILYFIILDMILFYNYILTYFINCMETCYIKRNIKLINNFKITCKNTKLELLLHPKELWYFFYFFLGIIVEKHF